MSDADNLLPWITLANAHGVGPAMFRRLLDRFGSPAAVLAASEAALCEVPRVGAAAAHAIREATGAEAQQRAERELNVARERGARLITMQAPDYPEHLRSDMQAPPVLYVRGEPGMLRGLVLSVVGSREPSEYGLRMTRTICAALARRGWTIVSGMAKGIDTAAHFAALDAGGQSAGVAGCGIAELPEDTFPSVKRLLADGTVVSEFGPEMPALKNNFPKRNRTISGLALGTLVVEAGETSGALITAGYAMDAGRPVFAIPGRTTDASSRGTNALIKRGARLVESEDDILSVFENEVARYGESSTMTTASDASPTRAEPTPVVDAAPRIEQLAERLPPEQAGVVRALSDGPVDLDSLFVATGLTPAALATALLRLEMAGYVVRQPGNRVALKQ